MKVMLSFDITIEADFPAGLQMEEIGAELLEKLKAFPNAKMNGVIEVLKKNAVGEQVEYYSKFMP